jgi:YfiH family protein
MRPGNDGNDESGRRADAASRSGDPLVSDTVWRVPEWRAVPHLVHGFLGRGHGLGPGSFDLGTLAVRLAAAGEAPRIVLAVRQVHGADVLSPELPEWNVLAPDDPSERLPAGDALVSASADVILTIRTADCVPILLVAPAARAVAAVHAGWRGLLAGVIGNAVAALCDRYGAQSATLEAAIGPAIGGCCYEFGVEHRDRFVARYGADAAGAWRPGGRGRAHLDLRVLAALALRAAGLDRRVIRTVGPCTAEHPESLHSYRRDGAGAGRQISYVGWSAG